LSTRLLSPFAEVLATHANLILIPYGLAHTLPFYVLPWQGKPLIESHTVSYLPSASTLQFLAAPTQGPRLDRILTIGNPTHMAYRSPLTDVVKSLRPLLYSTIEAKFIAGLFPTGKALVGDEATKVAVCAQLQQDYPILHFATHGYLAESAPLLSALLLANGDALSLYELMGMQLNADLVVLSACRTALGETTGGDDVLGLTRGLLAAGAKAAVVSLWPVDDASTSLLMSEFYRRLRDGEKPNQALRLAQNYLRTLSTDDIKRQTIQLKDAGFDDELAPVDSYSPPFFWAPFILVGV
jgi:CHAT domain-containing protein